MQNFRRSDPAAEAVVFATKIEDIIGGVTITSSDFVNGDVIFAGSLIGKDSTTGRFKVIKTAKLQASALNNATTYRLVKGHTFKVGEFIGSAIGAKSPAITAIDTTNADYDQITVDASIGVALNAADNLFKSSVNSTTTTSAFIVTPYAVTGSTIEIKAGDTNTVDAYIRATLFESVAPPVIAAAKTALPQILWI